MNLKQRLRLTTVLAPVFLLLFVWIYFVSPSAGLHSLWFILGQSVAMSFVCAYCVALFVAEVKAPK